MIYPVDAKLVQKLAVDLQQEGLSSREAWEQIKHTEICNCRRPMAWDEKQNRWTCECGNSRFNGR